MRLDPRDPVFDQPPLDLIRKYYFENGMKDYCLYRAKAGGELLLAAPAPVVIATRSRLKSQSFFLRSLEIRARSLILSGALDDQDTEIDGPTFAALLREGEKQTAVAQDDGLLVAEYPMQGGLFSYSADPARLNIRYHPDFGHGEHMQFFIASIGTPYGVFSPGSFVFVEGVNRHRSQLIYEELIQSRVISRSGMLMDAGRMRAYDFLTPLTDQQAFAVRSMVLDPPGLPSLRRRYAALLPLERAEIDRDLSQRSLTTKTDEIPGYISSLSEDEKNVLFGFFVSRVVSGLIGEESVRCRGILLENAKREILVVMYEPIEISSHYYGGLLAFFAREKPGYSLRIALAYRKPVKRRKDRALHPLVEALGDLENKKYLETAEIFSVEDTPSIAE